MRGVNLGTFPGLLVLKRRVRGENMLKFDGTSLGVEVEGDVTDMVAEILLIMGALLDRFKLTTV